MWLCESTIVAINHNCRNTNYNWRKKTQLQPQLSPSDQQQMSPQQPQLLQFFEKTFDLVNVYMWLKDDVSLSIINLDSIFSQNCSYFVLLTCLNIYL